MDKDRKVICDIISEMLDNPNENDIYPTSTAFIKLEHYVEEVRTQALGWANADACVALDKGDDPRLWNVPDLLERARKDLGNDTQTKRYHVSCRGYREP